MIDFIMQSSLEKIFVDQTVFKPEFTKASVLRGEEFAFQIAYKARTQVWRYCSVVVESELKKNIELYRVDNVPSLAPVYIDRKDNDYIKTTPGLFPDVLSKMDEPIVFAYPLSWSSLWVNVKVPQNAKKGIHTIKLIFDNPALNIHVEKVFTLNVIPAALPKQNLIVTQWFHCDGIARFYNQTMFSSANWKTLESYLKMAAEHGINMILTPIFTPPLDTQRGGERLTAQLVDITVNQGQYSFDFKKLKKWIDICQKHGVEYFEMAHLFTQWGAKCCPKIMGTVDGKERKIFGWEMASDSEEYFAFLDVFLPALTEFLKEKGVADKTVFHISDEPNVTHLDMYQKVKAHVTPYLEGFQIIDALSNLEFYNQGVIKHPVPSSNHVMPFIEAKVPDLWTYYCCSQNVDVSNRFMAMPSYRTRIIGLQLFKYDIKGFLQWGYNFYNSVWSMVPVNPYLVTDCLGAYPSGDAFSVYPGMDGKAVPSLRLKVFKHALQDISALELLAEYEGKEAVMQLIEQQGELKFDAYPRSAEFILSLREAINHRIANHVK